MSSEIEQYQTAKAEFERATKRCEQIAALVEQAALALKNWKRAMVSNASVGFPAEIALSNNTRSIDANQWISAGEIASALSMYHEAKAAMHNAYSAIPAAQREVIVPPPA